MRTRYGMVALGGLFLVLGAAGILLPALPTTPFLLLASYCFVRGSDRVNRWFVSTSLYKNHLEGYIREGAMPLRQKLLILALAYAMLMAAFFAMKNPYGRICILVLMAVKFYWFFFRIKTKR